MKKKLPIGIDNFEKIRENDYYYVDKTGMIKDLIMSGAEVTLFTRPRRFGKSLNMSMLKSFFSIDVPEEYLIKDSESRQEIFEGLKIADEEEICNKYMRKYPVIFLSMKEVSALEYAKARELIIFSVNEVARKNQYLLESEQLTDIDKDAYRRLLREDMTEAVLVNSLKILSELLKKHYGKKTIILIDEYDVPLAKAFEQGYYDEMTELIRGFFGQALKSNDSLEFAVLTGCMRISRESIFTGLNNLRVCSTTDVNFEEFFGFTDVEVQEMLADYDFQENYREIKEWYDGYRFGNTEVYCPWDVLNHLESLRNGQVSIPQNYWMNTSSNEIVRRFVQKAENGTIRREIERLVAGEEIEKELHQELTYREMYSSIENMWSVLFTTGYLTQKGTTDGKIFRLAIPNREIRDIFTIQIMSWFKESIKKDGKSLSDFCGALEEGNAEAVEERLNVYLKKTISIRDTFVRKQMKENFYHGILLGILGLKENWGIRSNRESGDGYSDIMIETEDMEKGIIIEIKYAEDGNLQKACEKALGQIENSHYDEELKDEGINEVLRYGIAFYKKRCKVMKSLS
ncbi:putative AAA-ATPase [Dorea longicatena]|uniref:Putative AAA-ATPase n=1 Tax=Dorea longicatena TaxID=88431 RepID=A0A564UUY6_9FIRM|nr:AAA family ATPase [Dorea longicatena]VUX23465.1 putative AAA-ATPase [Dorea longicatena]